MDDRDLHEMRKRVTALYLGLEHIGVLLTVQQRSSAFVGDFDMPLTAEQRQAIDDSIAAKLAEVEETAKTLPQMAGLVGTVDEYTIRNIQVDASRTKELLIDGGNRLLNMMAILKPVRQPDGTYLGALVDQDCQAVTNLMTTLCDCALISCATFRLASKGPAK